MKLPIMLRSTHKEVTTKFNEIIKDKNEELVRVKSDLAAANKTKDMLQNRNTELHVKLTVAEKKADTRQNTIDELEEQIKEHKECIDELRNQREQLEDSVHELHQDILDSGATIKEFMDRIKSLEFCNQESKKEIDRLKSLLKVNAIAKQQIRDMCIFKDKQGRYVKNESGEALVNEKVNGLKIWDLTVLLGE